MYRFVVNLIHPMTLLFLAAGWATFRLCWTGEATRRRRWLLGTSLVLLALFCTPAVGFLAAASLERLFPPLEQRPEEIDAIVVLSGGVLWPAPDDATTFPSDSTLRRCFRAVELYRQGPRCPIVVTGGYVHADRPGAAEADVLRDSLLSMGIPVDDILSEAESRSTYENAVASSRLLKQRGFRRVLLVTDARHLLRSTLCFRKQGVDVVPAGTGYTARHFRPSVFEFVPRAGAAQTNQDVFHELLGLAWYWCRGRI